MEGHPLYRISDAATGGPPVADAFAWPIIRLTPGTSYDVEVKVSDGAKSVVKKLAHTTPALPLPAGPANKIIVAGATQAAIQTTLNGLVPGDVLELQASADLTAPLVLDKIGSVTGAPIYIRGASRDGIVIHQTTGNNIFSVLAANNIIMENLTLQGYGVDQNSGAAFLFGNTDTAGKRIAHSKFVLRNCTVKGVDKFFSAFSNLDDTLVYENDLAGNNLWTPAFTETNITWDDEGIMLAGEGNCAWDNTIKGFGDSCSFAAHSGGTALTTSRGTHFYRNLIINSCDDAIETDYAGRNCSAYDNRVRNAMTLFSLDPLYGGPFLDCNNIAVNIGRQPYKCNSAQSGYFNYNNTVLRTTGPQGIASPGTENEVGWYQSNNGGQFYWGHRNNLLVYRGIGAQTLRLDAKGMDPIDFDHNGWYPDKRWQWHDFSVGNFALIAANVPATTPVFSGITKRHTGDVITVSNPWTVPVTLGPDYRTEVTEDVMLVLSPGDKAKGAGVTIPGITTSLDMGAQALTQYGDHSGDSVVLPPSKPAWLRTLNLAVGQWGEIPNTKISAAETAAWRAVKANTMLSAWGGMTIDPRDSTLYNLAGGGHFDGMGNQVPALKLSRDVPGWVEAAPPSDPAQVIQNSSLYADGRPTSRHQYWSNQFITRINRAVLVGMASAWGPGGYHMPDVASFDPATGLYDTAGFLPPIPLGAGVDCPICQDPTTENIYVWRGSGMSVFNALTLKWAFWPCPQIQGKAICVDSKRKRIWHSGPVVGGTLGSATLEILTHIVLDQPLTGPEAANINGAGAGVIYDPDGDCFLVRSSYVGGLVRRVNAETFAVDILPTTGDSIPAGDSSAGTGSYNRFLYCPQYKLAVYVPNYAGNVWVLRLA